MMISEMLLQKIFSAWMLLLLLLKFVRGCWLKFINISPWKYLVNSHSSPLFSAAEAAAITHRNYFLSLYQKTRYDESMAKFTQAVAKGFLNEPNLLLLIKQGSISPPRNMVFVTFGELEIRSQQSCIYHSSSTYRPWVFS